MSDVITISLASGIRTNGDAVSGILHLNVRLAKKKDVKAVRINLRGEIHTHVTVPVSKSDITADGETSTTSYELVREKVQLFDQAIVIWTLGVPLPQGSSEVVSFPFSFTMPLGELPPSFEVGDSQSGGSVKYFVHAVGERKSWYQRNIRTNQPFPFLPTDHTLGLHILPNWPGEWKTFGKSQKMRSGIIFHDGHVQAEFSMPMIPSIPLFRRIPIKLRIICSSRSFPTSAAKDISKFEFPRNPSLEECELVLSQTCQLQARGSSGKCSINLGLQGGFGKPNDKELRATWSNQVEKSTSPPYWVLNEGNKNKGRWREDVTFSSSITFRCPPPFKAQNIETSISLILEIYFAGLGNNMKLNLGPLALSSGIVSQQDEQKPFNWESLPAEKTTPQAHCNSPRELDLPPSYYNTILSDEKEKE